MDNDGDFETEKERVLYILDGSDHGWRLNWQWHAEQDFTKISGTTPYNPWMVEKLFLPDHSEHASYITPTIANFTPGPCGFTANPGTALSPELSGRFFMTNQQSEIRVISFEPHGASFKFVEHPSISGGTMNTGLSWTPDGALMVASFGGPKGVIHRVDVIDAKRNSVRESTRRILACDGASVSDVDLSQWLAHTDQRVRVKAQLEWVRRGKLHAMVDAAMTSGDDLAQLHAIWGVGMADRRSLGMISALKPFWKTSNEIVLAQLLRICGESSSDLYADQILTHLRHESIRVRSFAAMAVGRRALQGGASELVDMLSSDEAARDAYYRHALIMGIKGACGPEQLGDLAASSNRTVKLAAIVALRKLGAPQLVRFLDDDDERVLLEAARAIHDDLSVTGAMPDLAALLDRPGFTNEALLRRVINAAFRNGTMLDQDRLERSVFNAQLENVLRRQAFAALLWWDQPPPLDSVTGRYRYFLHRDPVSRDDFLRENLGKICEDEVLLEVLLNGVVVRDRPDWIEGLALEPSDLPASLHVKMISALSRSKASMAHFRMWIEYGLNSKKPSVREMARKHAGEVGYDSEQLLVGVIDDPEAQGRGRAILQLARKKGGLARGKIQELVAAYNSGTLDPELRLEVWKAAHRQNIELPARDDRLTHGGNPKRGKRLLRNHAGAQCMRCHQVEPVEGIQSIGPALAGIGRKLDQSSLVAALLKPSEQLASGYGVLSLELKNGEMITGTCLNETEEAWEVAMGNVVRKVSKSEVSKATTVSAMPPMGAILSDDEVRDLVAYMVTLR